MKLTIIFQLKKRYKIQEVIKPNQVILVQVLKDERGLGLRYPLLYQL